MNFNNSPLEMLAAFAVVFVTAAMSAIGLVKYIEKNTQGRARCP